MEAQCTQERFLNDVKSHAIDIVNDDGVSRFIRFKKTEGRGYWFDLITWPGHLCISGDCGTFVFSRIDDMFEFFRRDDDWQESHPGKIYINTGYWAEKLLSVCKSDGYHQYSEASFKENIRSYFKDHWEFDSWGQMREVWEDVKENVLYNSDDGEIRSYDAATGYKSYYGHEFTDFWEHNSKEYTFYYLWCIYAISWGIAQYDKAKVNNSENKVEVTDTETLQAVVDVLTGKLQKSANLIGRASKLSGITDVFQKELETTLKDIKVDNNKILGYEDGWHH